MKMLNLFIKKPKRKRGMCKQLSLIEIEANKRIVDQMINQSIARLKRSNDTYNAKLVEFWENRKKQLQLLPY